MRSVALVLGAGGAVGAAYHAGAVAALDDAGWDARRAELIVGTSAGSGIAASLRAGLAPADHLARATGAPLSAAGGQLLGPPRPLFDLRRRSGWLPLPASPSLAAAAFFRREPPRPGLALAGLLPRGTVPTGVLGDAVRSLHTGRWPDAPTWICAVDLASGRLVVFGRDDLADEDEPDLGRAVEASSAVPGLFRPVRIGRAHYVDGGVHSPTNADLVAEKGFDLVIVVSPMTAIPAALGRSVHAVGRSYHAGLLRREVDAVRRGGTPVIVVQPTRDDLVALGFDAMDRTRSGSIAKQAFESTRAKLERPDVAEVLGRVTPASTGTGSGRNDP